MTTLLDMGLAPESTQLLRPSFETRIQPAYAFEAHQLRVERLGEIAAFNSIQSTLVDRRLDPSVDDLPFLTPAGIRDTYENTQNQGEAHRVLVPRLQEIAAYPDTRKQFLNGIDEASRLSTERLIDEADRNGGFLVYDVAILGSGPHGTAAAMRLREQFPGLRVLMVDRDGLGGIWHNNGPNASYFMNSRVRRANRSLPRVPRTGGNINPTGFYGVLEVSDLVQGNYAKNTELGDLTAINAFLSVDDTLIGCEATRIADFGDSASMLVTTPDGARQIEINVRALINAPGIAQESTLNPINVGRAVDGYFTSNDIYRYFGNYDRKPSFRPLEAFKGKDIIVAGAGDSALTALEALLGVLPAETYGPGGFNFKPRSIIWVGAPGTTAEEIDRCLRSRYKNGIIQALPKSVTDQGALIRPIPMRGTSYGKFAAGFELYLENNTAVSGDVLFDCTNRKRIGPYGPQITDLRIQQNRQAVYTVGPGENGRLPDSILEDIARLGIGENTVALWALIGLTDRDSFSAGQAAVQNGGRRGR